MATHVISHACILLLLISLGYLAWGKLDLPTVVGVHAGQKTHILCTYTCQESDSCNVQLDWKDRPSEFLSFKRCYNGSHHSLRMNVEAGSQEVKTSQIVTCVAMTTNGTILEEGSTHLEICPTETMMCRFDKEPLQTSPTVHMCACQYQSECATIPKCQSYKEKSPIFHGINDTGSWKVARYEFIALKPGDSVTCRLDSPSIEEHLQTTVELVLPGRILTKDDNSGTDNGSADEPNADNKSDEETQTYPTPAETSTKPPPNQSPVNSSDSALPWVLFGLTFSVLLLVYFLVGVCVYQKRYKHVCLFCYLID